MFYTFFLCVMFYAPTHLNLFKYLKNLGYKTSELLCIFNLTNIDHNLYDRLGMFVLKQINYMGFIAFVIFLIAIIISKKQIQKTPTQKKKVSPTFQMIGESEAITKIKSMIEKTFTLNISSLLFLLNRSNPE